ncbi:PHP domain-containing protein [candidate division KSB1 bacterium]|nr:PHP domain-containing protein [candidate division KSB1 bacterium]
MKADLHIHSMYSIDSIAKPESILAAAADRSIGIIAITDHVTTDGWKAFNHIKNKYPVDIINGQEIKVYQDNRIVGEILGLYLEKPVQSKNTIGVIDEIRAQNGLISIAHPFSERRHEFLAYTEIDNWQDIAIEILNGRTYNSRDNEMAKNLAKRLNTPITAGSDAHTPFEVGNVYLEFDGKTPEDLKKAILNHDVKATGQSSSVLFSIISGFGRLGLAI